MMGTFWFVETETSKVSRQTPPVDTPSVSSLLPVPKRLNVSKSRRRKHTSETKGLKKMEHCFVRGRLGGR